MRVAQKFAGYSLEEADNLRKACGKKIRALIAAEREKFVAGCVAAGLRRGARHAALRHHRALRRLRLQQVPLLRLRARRLPDGVAQGPLPGRVPGGPAHLGQGQQGQDGGLPGRVPVAGHRGAACPTSTARVAEFAPPTGRGEPRPGAGAGDHLRPGRGAQRRARASSSGSWPSANANGPFADFFDFCQRVDPVVLNKRTMESLVKGGAFDSLGHPRQGLCLVFEEIVDRTLERRREQDLGIISLFAAFETGAGRRTRAGATPGSPIPDTEFDKAQRLAFEKEMLGLYVSDHPLMGYEAALSRHTDCTLSDMREEDAVGRPVARCGRSGAW